MFQGGGGGSGDGGGSAYFEQQQLFHALDGIGMVDAAGVEAYTGAEGGGGLGPAVLSSDDDGHCHALLYNLSVLKDKVRQLEPLVGGVVDGSGQGPQSSSSHGISSHVSSSVSIESAGAIIQEIITAASSMMYAFQQLSRTPVVVVSSAAQQGVVGHARNDGAAAAVVDDGGGAAGCSDQQQQQQHMQVMDDHAAMQQWHHGSGYYYTVDSRPPTTTETAAASPSTSTMMTDNTIIELDAAELLARYTHYCQVCGKGFKRDANLRMHMRAHGDEYKSKAALSNPTTTRASSSTISHAAAGEDADDESSKSEKKKYYSCPHEGCRWNKKHAKFQPLKSVICVKNHYKRSHCPKMYMCNRCNRKHFSVLSDLRTHEKHCGNRRWLCSCGTTFSRKDKLAGHVSLFAGHQPVVVDVVPPPPALMIGAAAGGHGGTKRSAPPPSASPELIITNCGGTAITGSGFGMS